MNNQGKAAAPAPVKVVFGITASSDTSGKYYWAAHVWDDFTGGVRWGPDSLWENGQFTFALPPCITLGVGAYRWILIIDPDGIIRESDKTNNKAASSATFQVIL
jgi:hypothetical protein